MHGRITFALATMCAAFAAYADQHVSASPDGATLYFIEPADGAVVESPITVKFGLSGMGVAPAGTNVDNTGHHHLLINLTAGEVDLSAPLPATDSIRHFGAGQTETEVALPEGTHRLRLMLGNYLHIPHDPPVMSEEITVIVAPAK